MNRSTLILGFALLVVAATLAITITFRNDPRLQAANQGATPRESTKASEAPGPHSERAIHQSKPTRSNTRPPAARDRFEVTIPVESLATLSPDAQAEFHQRAEIVQREARQKLERMTEEFELTSGQRAKIFPVLARSTPGFDPVMQVGGIQLAADPVAPAGEELHDLFDADQRVQLEDQEVDRQLWWQDLFERIETELIDSTGGLPTQGSDDDSGTGTAAPVDPGPERTAPSSRGGRDR